MENSDNDNEAVRPGGVRCLPEHESGDQPLNRYEASVLRPITAVGLVPRR